MLDSHRRLGVLATILALGGLALGMPIPLAHAQARHGESGVQTISFPFFDDFEGGLGNWLVSGQDWDTTSVTFRSPGHAITDSPGGNYPNWTNATITLASPIDLTSTAAPVLSFWHRYNVQSGHDFCHVEVSEDGGFTWSELARYTGYINTLNLQNIDLSAYTTSPILIRFRIRDNGNTYYDGWYIDDVSIDGDNGGLPQIACPPVPDMVAACGPGEVCIPLTIIDATSVDAGDATWSAGSLCFTPDSPGLYSFTVIATNEAGSDTCEVEVVVEHTPPPIACFVAQPASGTAPLSVAFSNCSTPADGVEYLWDFGEGSTSALFEPEHTFADVGTYTVSLTVTNECGVHMTDSVVEVREAGTALLQFSPYPLELHPASQEIPGTVQLMVDSTEPVMGVTAEVHYDPSLVNIRSITTGPFLGSNGGQVTSQSVHDNDSGVLSVSMAVLGGNPIGVSGSGSLLSIELIAVAEDPTSSLAFASVSLRDPENTSIPTDTVDGEIIEACALLGDYDDNGRIDFEDFVIFMWCWNEFPDTLCADLCGPVTGPAPPPPPWTVCNYPYPPDGVVNFEDLMVFVQKYNWSGGYSKSATGGEAGLLAGGIPMAAVLSATGRSGSLSDGVVGVSLEVPGVEDAIGWHFELEFDRRALRFVGTSLEEALDLEGNHVVVLDRLQDDRVEINRAVLGVPPDPAHGAQTVEFWFECLGEVEETVVTLVHAEVHCSSGGRAALDTGDDGVSLSLRTGGSGLTLPARVMLRQNTPNPFAGGTVIRFDLPHAMQAELTVYDVQGRRVRNLASGVHGAGSHEKPWDGRDDQGMPSASGIYFYRLTTEGGTETKRMLLTR